MSSTPAKIFNGILKVINLKALINRQAKTGNRGRGAFFSKTEKEKHQIFTTYIDQREVSVMGKDRDTSLHVIYFHGGMYTLEGNVGHKRWLIHLFESVDCKITFVDYPLAPESTVLETVSMVVHTYQFLAKRFPKDDFTLMGDSAGGGLALVLAQYLRDQNFCRRPGKLILYSPWIRLDMENPEIQNIAEKDNLLDLDMLKKSAKAYAGTLDLSHQYLSPYFASCEDLGKIHVFYGSDEILAPDISALERKCMEEKVQSAFYCYAGMQHVFHLFTFLPESKAVLTETIKILNDSQQKMGSMI